MEKPQLQREPDRSYTTYWCGCAGCLVCLVDMPKGDVYLAELGLRAFTSRAGMPSDKRMELVAIY